MVQVGRTITAEELAQKFHELYEDLAPAYNYKTREESSVAWHDVPENNKQLMIAVAGCILNWLEEEVS